MEKNNLKILDSNIGIYMILNLENNKYYIGSSRELKRRKSRHFGELKRGKHHNDYLQNSYNKYGRDLFQFIILENTSLGNLLEREYYWILLKDSINTKKGYNLSLPNKDGGTLSHSEYTKEKLRVVKYNHLLRLGKDIGTYKEWTSKVSTEKQRQKDYIKPLHSPNSKEVLQLNKLTGDILNTFPSIKEAALYHSVSREAIRKVTSHERKTCKKFIFILKGEYNPNTDYRILPKPNTRKYTSTYIKKPYSGYQIKKLSLDNTLLEVFPSILLAALSLNSSCPIKQVKKRLSACCRNETNSYQTFNWEYIL